MNGESNQMDKALGLRLKFYVEEEDRKSIF